MRSDLLEKERLLDELVNTMRVTGSNTDGQAFLSVPESLLVDVIRLYRALREEREASEAAWPPGYAGPAPDGVNYSDWLAMNNID